MQPNHQLSFSTRLTTASNVCYLEVYISNVASDNIICLKRYQCTGNVRLLPNLLIRELVIPDFENASIRLKHVDNYATE